MKTLVLFVACTIGLLVNAHAQSLPNMGLVANLNYFKSTIEYKVRPAIMELKSGKPVSDLNKKIILNYVQVKTILDQIIDQLKADLVSSNSISVYRQVDNLCKKYTLSTINSAKGNNKTRCYINALYTLNTNTSWIALCNPSDKNDKDYFELHLMDNALVQDVGASDIFSFITDGIGVGLDIATQVRETKKAKVDGMVAILDALKPADLSSFKLEKEEKKEEKK